jgi:hypothetical protein
MGTDNSVSKLGELSNVNNNIFLSNVRGHHGRDRMVVSLTTTYAISAYHH